MQCREMLLDRTELLLTILASSLLRTNGATQCVTHDATTVAVGEVDRQKLCGILHVQPTFQLRHITIMDMPVTVQNWGISAPQLNIKLCSTSQHRTHDRTGHSVRMTTYPRPDAVMPAMRRLLLPALVYVRHHSHVTTFRDVQRNVMDTLLPCESLQPCKIVRACNCIRGDTFTSAAASYLRLPPVHERVSFASV